MASTQLRGSTQIKDGTIENLQISATAGISTTKLADSANFILRTGAVAFTAAQSMGGYKLTNLGTPTASTDAVTKGYADALSGGLDFKESVVVASTANINLATGGLLTIDGITLVANDRVLVKDQTTGSENGIYLAASGAWSRSTDADASSEVTGGMYCFVNEGPTNGNKGFVLTTNDPITLDTTSLTFTEFITSSGALLASNNLSDLANASTARTNLGVAIGSDVQAWDADLDTLAGLAKTDSNFIVGNGSTWVVENGATARTSLGLGSIATQSAASVNITGGTLSNITDIAVADGGTGASTAATARTNLGIGSLGDNERSTREVPSGSINGSNVTFTLANTPVSGTEEAYLNGILQNAGSGNDYTISGLTITMLTAPIAGDVLLCSYWY